ncbi:MULTISPECIES: hypothetical protein [unclassified Leifsonia]|uniref:hypothetical protein n=1 Tax=unclassified Leifsonia TaxID=2663824 RepID=UPI000B0411FF|nr:MULTISPECIES: hypothetical protein [unclassified Leifsonia]
MSDPRTSGRAEEAATTPSGPATRHRRRWGPFVWYSIALCTGLGVLIHGTAMAPPLGWTPPLVAGFYLLFLFIWTIPTSMLLGLALGLGLRWAVDWSERRAPAWWRSGIALSIAYGLLAAGGFALIFSRAWTNGVGLFAAGAGFCVGVAMVLVLRKTLDTRAAHH